MKKLKSNKIIMDYDFYTFILDRNNNIVHKISHNENSFENKIVGKANKIIANNVTKYIAIKTINTMNLKCSSVCRKSMMRCRCPHQYGLM